MSNDILRPIERRLFLQTIAAGSTLLLPSWVLGRNALWTPDDLPLTTLIPAFMISEVTTAFAAGFIIFIPFLIIDMVVACVLLSMGMMMLPPMMISLPFKILLFVLVDGWSLLIGSVVKSFQ